MTVIYDATIQHQGWSTGDFATAGWDDTVLPLVTPFTPGSCWVTSQNGLFIDLGLTFWPTSLAADAVTPFNNYIGGPTQATFSGLAPVTTASHLVVYTRTHTPSNAILARVIVSDQPTTPPPTAPP